MGLALVTMGWVSCSKPAAPPATITVDSRGSVQATPDQFNVSLLQTIDVSGKTKEEAVAEARKAQAELAATLKGQGVVEVTEEKTIVIFDQDIQGFVSPGSLVVSIATNAKLSGLSTERMEGLLDEWPKLPNVTFVSSPRGQCSDPQPYRIQAIVKAWTNAQARAERVAAAVGCTPGPAINWTLEVIS